MWVSVLDSASGASTLPAGRWSIDPERSSVAFAVKHMLLSTVNGCFHSFQGTLELGSESPRATGTVEAASIDTEDSIRDEHLRRSPDFFDAERYPEINFTSTHITQHRNGRLHIDGELTIRGTTGQIELHAQTQTPPHQPHNTREIQLQLHGELDRRDYGLTWNQPLDTGRLLLGNKIKIALQITATRDETAS
jgi:polyisoprenoid-binding protein YceI